MTQNLKIEQDIITHAIDGLTDRIGNYCQGCDLHNKLFNEDYFIIGYYEARKWIENGPGVFQAIELIKEYEQSNFGQVSTDFSNEEEVANMFSYIQGEELLGKSSTLQDAWDRCLTEDDIKNIMSEISQLR